MTAKICVLSFTLCKKLMVALHNNLFFYVENRFHSL